MVKAKVSRGTLFRGLRFHVEHILCFKRFHVEHYLKMNK